MPSITASSRWPASSVGLILAGLTVAAWLLVLPLDWSEVPTGIPGVYANPIETWQWMVIVVVLGMLAVVSAWARVLSSSTDAQFSSRSLICSTLGSSHLDVCRGLPLLPRFHR